MYENPPGCRRQFYCYRTNGLGCGAVLGPDNKTEPKRKKKCKDCLLLLPPIPVHGELMIFSFSAHIHTLNCNEKGFVVVLEKFEVRFHELGDCPQFLYLAYVPRFIFSNITESPRCIHLQKECPPPFDAG